MKQQEFEQEKELLHQKQKEQQKEIDYLNEQNNEQELEQMRLKEKLQLREDELVELKQNLNNQLCQVSSSILNQYEDTIAKLKDEKSRLEQ